MGKVTKSYVVCATPRSGSTLLCALLAGTGVAGRPEEYFECLWRTGRPRQPREYFAGVGDAGVLALLALRYVHVTRGDKVAQAVSLWRAAQTLAWRAEEDGREHGAVYHAGAIGHLVAQLSEQDEAWRAWFAANGIQPLTIAYEELAADAAATAGAVLAHVGAGTAEIPAPPLRRQGDDRSTRWVERFRGARAAV